VELGLGRVPEIRNVPVPVPVPVPERGEGFGFPWVSECAPWDNHDGSFAARRATVEESGASARRAEGARAPWAKRPQLRGSGAVVEAYRGAVARSAERLRPVEDGVQSLRPLGEDGRMGKAVGCAEPGPGR
jgi:hypothetical protein